MNKNLSDYKHFSLFIWLFALTVLYFAINRLNMKIHRTNIFLDDYIPFVKYMVIPYMLYYFYLWGTYIYLAFKQKELFIVHAKTNIYCCLICIVIFLVYPTYVVRPEIYGTDILTKAINLLYKSDNPSNALPSLHVLQSVLTHIAISRIPNIRKYIKNISLIAGLLIIISTMMIKQHYILDGIAAILIALPIAKVTYSKLYKNKYFIHKNTTTT